MSLFGKSSFFNLFGLLLSKRAHLIIAGYGSPDIIRVIGHCNLPSRNPKNWINELVICFGRVKQCASLLSRPKKVLLGSILKLGSVSQTSTLPMMVDRWVIFRSSERIEIGLGHTVPSGEIWQKYPIQLNNTHFEGKIWKNTLNSTHRTRL